MARKGAEFQQTLDGRTIAIVTKKEKEDKFKTLKKGKRVSCGGFSGFLQIRLRVVQRKSKGSWYACGDSEIYRDGRSRTINKGEVVSF